MAQWVGRVAKEEAFAPATVAFPRPRHEYLVLGPLDMCGFFGAATFISSLQYGGGFLNSNTLSRYSWTHGP